MIEIPLSKSISLISPRLTVLINTIDEAGELNSSPYSWVFPLSSDPPLIGVGIGGRNKLSFINSERTGEFVVCVVSVNFGQQAIDCEESHKPGDKLWERYGLHLTVSRNVSVPRIKEAMAVLECKVTRLLEYDGDHVVLVGEVVTAEAESGGLDEATTLASDGCGGRDHPRGRFSREHSAPQIPDRCRALRC